MIRLRICAKIRCKNVPKTMSFVHFRGFSRILRMCCTFSRNCCMFSQEFAKACKNCAKTCKNYAKKRAKPAQNMQKKNTVFGRFVRQISAQIRRRTNFHTAHLCAALIPYWAAGCETSTRTSQIKGEQTPSWRKKH